MVRTSVVMKYVKFTTAAMLSVSFSGGKCAPAAQRSSLLSISTMPSSPQTLPTYTLPAPLPTLATTSFLSVSQNPTTLAQLISVLLCLAYCSQRNVFRVLRSGSCSTIRTSSSFRPTHDPLAGMQHVCPFRRWALELFPVSVTMYGAARKLFVQIPV